MAENDSFSRPQVIGTRAKLSSKVSNKNLYFNSPNPDFQLKEQPLGPMKILVYI